MFLIVSMTHARILLLRRYHRYHSEPFLTDSVNGSKQFQTIPNNSKQFLSQGERVMVLFLFFLKKKGKKFWFQRKEGKDLRNVYGIGHKKKQKSSSLGFTIKDANKSNITNINQIQIK